MTSTASKTTRRDAAGGLASGTHGSEAPKNVGASPLRRILSEAEMEAQRKFAEWQARYRPVEDAIYAERDRREHRRRVRRGRAFGDLCEMTEGRAAFCRRTGVTMEESGRLLSRRRAIHPSLEPWLFLGDMAWSAMNAVRKELTRRIARAKHIAMRPAYYERERARRLALASERRKVRRRSTSSPCPTREQILDAWVRAKDSGEAMLRFGSLMEDLECYVDNSLIHDGGVIIGRRAGIKGWLQMNIPALYLKYKTVMAYKAAAKRMRQLIGLTDPAPLSSVMPCGNEGEAHNANSEEREGGEVFDLQDYSTDQILHGVQETMSGRRGGRAIRGGKDASVRQGRQARRGDARGKGRPECIAEGPCADGRQGGKDTCGRQGGKDTCGRQGGGREADCPGVADGPGRSDLRRLRAAAIYGEIINLIGTGRRTQTRLVRRLKSLTDPNAIEDANMLAEWRRFYENEITVRTKSKWGGRLIGAIYAARHGVRGGDRTFT